MKISTPVKILIVDDHKMIRDGLRNMIESQGVPSQFYIQEAASGEEGIEKIKHFDFDIIIMDYQLPGKDGAQTIAEMLIYKSDLKILALSNYDEHMYINNILKAGARGFVLKNIEPEELIKAMETIIGGHTYYSHDIATRLVDASYSRYNFSQQASPSQSREGDAVSTLSEREKEILNMIAGENTNEQIAKKLNVSVRTIHTHRSNILRKLGVKNTAGLIKAASILKLI